MNSERIKFLVISSAYPYRGGISDSTHSLCNELINPLYKYNYKIIIFKKKLK